MESKLRQDFGEDRKGFDVDKPRVNHEFFSLEKI